MSTQHENRPDTPAPAFTLSDSLSLVLGSRVSVKQWASLACDLPCRGKLHFLTFFTIVTATPPRGGKYVYVVIMFSLRRGHL